MKILVSAFAILVGSNVATLSAEKVLKFKLATIFIGQKDGESHLMGVTVFPDGRLGTKEFFDKAGANGASTGRSTYFFDNGSIDVTYSGAGTAGHYKGEYVIVSGTGDYQGATGTGTIDGFTGKASPLKNANLFDIELDIKTP